MSYNKSENTIFNRLLKKYSRYIMWKGVILPFIFLAWFSCSYHPKYLQSCCYSKDHLFSGSNAPLWFC